LQHKFTNCLNSNTKFNTGGIYGTQGNFVLFNKTFALKTHTLTEIGGLVQKLPYKINPTNNIAILENYVVNPAGDLSNEKLYSSIIFTSDNSCYLRGHYQGGLLLFIPSAPPNQTQFYEKTTTQNQGKQETTILQLINNTHASIITIKKDLYATNVAKIKDPNGNVASTTYSIPSIELTETVFEYTITEPTINDAFFYLKLYKNNELYQEFLTFGSFIISIHPALKDAPPNNFRSTDKHSNFHNIQPDIVLHPFKILSIMKFNRVQQEINYAYEYFY